MIEACELESQKLLARLANIYRRDN
jgi:hypothetical protein